MHGGDRNSGRSGQELAKVTPQRRSVDSNSVALTLKPGLHGGRECVCGGRPQEGGAGWGTVGIANHSARQTITGPTWAPITLLGPRQGAGPVTSGMSLCAGPWGAAVRRHRTPVGCPGPGFADVPLFSWPQFPLLLLIGSHPLLTGGQSSHWPLLGII